ncbi:MAG: hypothetical protein ACI8XO_002874 [Verrucomicrobiales bacterium]|jgi:hypothetical protein
MVNEWLPGGWFWAGGWWPLHYSSPNDPIVANPERHKAFPYGVFYSCIPETLKIRELEHFCALANGSPVLPETVVFHMEIHPFRDRIDEFQLF